MKVLRSAGEMRAWSLERKRAGQTIGFVPTMGALHEGHASLLRASVEQNDVSVVSIFVNPAQFAPHEDLDTYPRTFDADSAMAEEIGVDAAYVPRTSEVYSEGYATYIQVERITERLCGASRPTFFRGVATVVTKLFNAVQPDRAYFGQKDAQQAAVIRRMTCDLDFGIEIVELPIVRESDGLALSSRNQYLSAEERQRGLCLSRAVLGAKEMLEAGERDAAKIVSSVRETMAEVDIDYVELVDAEEITPVDRVEGAVLLAVAAQVGPARLIDNIKFTP